MVHWVGLDLKQLELRESNWPQKFNTARQPFLHTPSCSICFYVCTPLSLKQAKPCGLCRQRNVEKSTLLSCLDHNQVVFERVERHRITQAGRVWEVLRLKTLVPAVQRVEPLCPKLLIPARTILPLELKKLNFFRPHFWTNMKSFKPPLSRPQ